MKVSDYQQDAGGKSGFIKIIMNDTKGCGQLLSDNTFTGIWFIRVKTTEEKNAEVVDDFFQLKTSTFSTSALILLCTIILKVNFLN